MAAGFALLLGLPFTSAATSVVHVSPSGTGSQHEQTPALSSRGGYHSDVQESKLRTEIADAHEKRLQTEAQLNALKSGDPLAPNAALDARTDEIVASDPKLLLLKSSLALKRDLLLEQLAGMTAHDPLRKTTEGELAHAEYALQAMQTQLRDQAAASLEQKLRTDRKITDLVESTLRTELQSSTQQAAHAEPSLQASRASDRTATVHLSSAAATPTAPSPNYSRWILVLLLPFTLLATVAGVVLIDWPNDLVRSGMDVERVLGFAPMGALFRGRDGSTQIFDECTRQLAASIDQLARTCGVRIIVLTPASAGATSVAQHLGKMLARLGRNTLAIDSSGAKAPVVFVPLNLKQSAHHGIGGHPPARPGETSASSAVIAQPFAPSVTPLTTFMKNAFQQGTTNYHLVLVEAEPVLLAPQIESLARMADVTVLIAEADDTTKTQLMQASQVLERLKVRGMATVLNNFARNRSTQTAQEELRARTTQKGDRSVRWNQTWDQPEQQEQGLGDARPVEQAVQLDPTYAN